MPDVTIHAKLRNAIRDVAITGGTVDVALGAAFGIEDFGYLPGTQSFKLTEDGLNGSHGAPLVVNDDAPTPYAFLFPDGVTVVSVEISGSGEQDLEEILYGDEPPTGDLLTVQGVLYRPNNTVWSGMKCVASLVERFITQDGIYPPVTGTFKVTQDGLNGTGGISLYAPNGEASRWLFQFYESAAPDALLVWEQSALFDASMGTVEIADVLDGVYATWIAPMTAPASVTLAATSVTLDDVLISWTNTASDRTGTEIWHSDDEGATWNLLTTAAAVATSYTHTSPTLGEVEQRYRLKHVKSGGQSGWTTATITDVLLGALSHHKLGEAAGNNRVSSIGSHTLSEVGGTVAQLAGKIGNAADFTSSQNRRLQSTAYPTLAQVAITFWVKLDSGGSGGVLTLEGSGVGIRVRNAGTDDFRIGLGNGNQVTLTGVTSDTWHFIYLAYDTVTKIGYGSVNNGTVVEVFDSNHDANLTAPVLSLGIAEGQAWGDVAIDALTITNRVLSAVNLDTHFNEGDGREHPFS